MDIKEKALKKILNLTCPKKERIGCSFCDKVNVIRDFKDIDELRNDIIDHMINEHRERFLV